MKFKETLFGEDLGQARFNFGCAVRLSRYLLCFVVSYYYDRPYFKTLSFVILFSCGASGYVQIAFLGMSDYIRNKREGGMAMPAKWLWVVVWPERSVLTSNQ